MPLTRAVAKTATGYSVCRADNSNAKVTHDLKKLSSIPRYYRALPTEVLGTLDKYWDSYFIGDRYGFTMFLGTSGRVHAGYLLQHYKGLPHLLDMVLYPEKLRLSPGWEPLPWSVVSSKFRPVLEPLGWQNFFSEDTPFFGMFYYPKLAPAYGHIAH